MRAFVFHEFGGNEKLQVDDVAEPLLWPDSVLIRTKAVSVNPVDWKILRGGLQSSTPTNFPVIPCWDVAGVVEKVGPAVVEFAPGDEVLAYNRQDVVQFGTLSDKVSLPLRCVGHKPQHLTWAEAAAIPLAGLTAHQAIDAAEVHPNETVLVLNATGGVGTFAVQFASRHGATVIGTGSDANHDYLRSIGANPVHYGEMMEKEVRELAPAGVDVVLDFIGGEALDVAPNLLTDDGRLVSIVDAKKTLSLGGRYVFVHPDSGQLTELAAIAGSGHMHVEVAATFPFEEAPAAFAMSEAGHVRGKIVITFG